MGDIRRIAAARQAGPAEPGGETPTLRLFSLLELISTHDQLFTLQGLVEETGLPKPTLHRMLAQLEGAGLLIRQDDGRHYGVGFRLRRMAENLLINDTYHGARHAVLQSLVKELGESCNITALSGSEVVYLDRVETAEPLRVTLQPGSRVPVHASASGKMIVSQFAPAQRRRLLSGAELTRYTPKTLSSLDLLEEDLNAARERGYAIDDEEFLPGLVCAAVLVPTSNAVSNLCVAVQGPFMRLTPEKAADLVPALLRAAEALGRIEAEAADTAGEDRDGEVG